MEFKLPRSKRIGLLALDDYINTTSFEHSLNQLEVVEVKGTNMSIEHTIEYLNPNKLNSLGIVSSNFLRLSGLEATKVKYSKLGPLDLIATCSYSNAENVTNMNFLSNIKLGIEGKLADASNDFLKFDIEYNNMELIDNNIEELGYFDLNCSFNHDF
ncbi:hypothetical protein K502DRAFT_350793 [Neoconidiobolus thromboides FSU 785]|nr:hypothetical protein K502DRAFT_350793 [Neoconidiobolus thromboides FSU 785]